MKEMQETGGCSAKKAPPRPLINARSVYIYISVNAQEIQFPLGMNSLDSSNKISSLALGVIMRETKKKRLGKKLF